MGLNQRANNLVDELLLDTESLNIGISSVEGARVLDFGCQSAGGLEAGRRLAELCLGGLGRVSLSAGKQELWPGPSVVVSTDQPLLACLGAQYAGWSLTADYVSPTSGKIKSYFAMASGPMRSVRGKEDVLGEYDLSEPAQPVVGVLESSKLPPAEVVRETAEQCGVSPSQVTLAIARTASIAGCVQIAARSVETAMHKLHELGFDLRRVRSGFGSAPLPPVAKDDMAAIGRTNDAVLYGGEVTLWVDGDDTSIEAVGPKTPSQSSRDYGRPFGDVFKDYEYDFYRVDPLLFSPAVINFYNVETGSCFTFGEMNRDVIAASFRG
jgi:methenyltetrahydromethanopterin cyclohydrolase